MNTVRPVLILAAWLTAGGALAGGHESAAPGGDAAAGKDKAAACTGCHTADEFSGMEQTAIAEAVRAVADGSLAHPGVGELSADDIADIAAYFASAGG